MTSLPDLDLNVNTSQQRTTRRRRQLAANDNSSSSSDNNNNNNNKAAFASIEYSPEHSDAEGDEPAPEPSLTALRSFSMRFHEIGVHVPRTATVYRWLRGLLVGLMTAICAFTISLVVANFEGLRFVILSHHTRSFVVQLAQKCAFNAALVIVASTVVLTVGPRAAGSGVPEVKGFLNGVNIHGALAKRTLFAKVVGSALAVSAGLAVGKEGPFIHIGSCIADAQWRRTARRGQRERRDLVTIGAASGVAAAFQAPLGGVLFALEEASTHWRSELTWRAFAATAVTAVAVELFAVACKSGGNPCGYYSGSGFVLFEVPRLDLPSRFLAQVWAIVPLAVLGGMMGAFFTTRNIKLNAWRTRTMAAKSRGWRVLEVVIVSIVTTMCAHALPFVVPSCVSGEPPGSERFRRFVAEVPLCKSGEYSALAALLINPQEQAIRILLTSAPGQISGPALAIFSLYYYVLNCVTFGVAVPAGLFTPSILIGGALGRAYCGVLRAVVPPVLLPGGVDPTLYTILGAAAYMGGLMRMTVSLCVIILEITGSLHPLPLVMLTLSVAKMVGDRFCSSVYEEHLKLKGVPFLDQRPPRNSDGSRNAMRVSEAMCRDVLAVPVKCTAEVLMKILSDGTTYSSFPVVDNDRCVVGVARRQDLMRLADSTVVAVRARAPLDLRQYARYVPPALARRPLAEAYSSFRWLGVRLLPVVSSARGRLVGVLTRSDLLGWSGTWLAERAAMDLDRDEAADDEAAAFDASRHSYNYDDIIDDDDYDNEHGAAVTTPSTPNTPLLVSRERESQENLMADESAEQEDG